MYQDSPSQQQIADYFDFGMIASMQMPFEIMDSMQLSPPLDFSLPVENPAIIQYSEHIEVGAPTFADAISGEIIKYFIVGDNESGIPVIPQQIYDASQPNPLPFHHQLEQQYYYQQEQQQLSLTSPPTSPAQLQKTTSEAQSLPNVSSTIVSQFKNGSVKPTSPTPTNTSATVAAVARKQKSMRFKATPAELSYLLSIFEANPFPTAAKRAEICDRLNLSDKQVVVWFQNRRASCKANGILAVKPPKKNGSSKSRLESIAFKAKKNGAVALSQLSEENPYFFELQRLVDAQQK
ncbi:hypothetical protein HK100_000702 [Physocladia obscura]|uniref:Homeobox domain-containing protein n=1 Tax=Physocladia obscura TaxID=109957 RepID=A0AAD5XCD7_9FUNG|nr:hypothetical protein HK100_000702 [Physocladia obscura]